MFPAEDIRSLEEAAYRSWPARKLELFDNWELRYADGFSRRGNSVYARGTSSLAWADKLRHCDSWFRSRGLGLVFRQTPETEAGLDWELESAGFGVEGKTNVMVASLDGYEFGGAAKARSEDWVEAATDLWKIAGDRQPAWRGILDRVELPADYRILMGESGPEAVGLGVVSGGWLGIFELIVAESHRRRGLGNRLLGELMSWGSAQGASRAYLQVVVENEPAIALYQSAGYEDAYQYWYRRSPS